MTRWQLLVLPALLCFLVCRACNRDNDVHPVHGGICGAWGLAPFDPARARAVMPSVGCVLHATVEQHQTASCAPNTTFPLEQHGRWGTCTRMRLSMSHGTSMHTDPTSDTKTYQAAPLPPLQPCLLPQRPRLLHHLERLLTCIVGRAEPD